MTRVLVVRAAGTNCDRETAHAFAAVGGAPETRHVNELLAEPALLRAYRILVFPGGFSYGDDIAAGRVFATELRQRLGVAAQHQHAGRVGIEPVGERRRPRQAVAQIVETFFEIGRAAGTGMHGEPGRLVDHQDQPVAMEDARLDLLGGQRRRSPGRRLARCSMWPHRSGHRSSQFSLAS